MLEKLEEIEASQLLTACKYWIKRWPIFNAVVGVVGLIAVVYFSKTIILDDIVGIIIWGVVANMCYTVGYLLDSILIVQTKGKYSLEIYRKMLFWIGTIAYALVSASLAWSYFTYDNNF